MQLSIIIVNYNVKHFLEQCLHSVYKAIHSAEAEIFVVDNNSVDGSCAMVREKFPGVHLIENKENTGFSKANNQAIRLASGKYILLLNPDTVVEEHTFDACISFMEAHPEAGAMGVKMIDGKGNFLPESKRALPTPSVAFFKIFGLSALFPHSPIFSRYHLGHLNTEKTHEIEILPGAFMFIRKEALEKTGLLDETFFMYGEDIDLSWRIIKAGYRNYYHPGTTIIHYKGESTKKGSINYVVVFYNAMIIFARKHFSKKNARLFSTLINAAIYFRAGLSILKRFFGKILLPLLDFLFVYGGYYYLTQYYEKVKFGHPDSYPTEYLTIVVPSYILLWMLSIFFSGGYERSPKPGNVGKGIFSGTIILLIAYALLPEHLRYSRALLLFGAAWAFIASLGLRFLLHISGLLDFRVKNARKNKLVIVGYYKEAARVNDLLLQTQIRQETVGYVCPDEEKLDHNNYIGSLSQLKDIITVNKINEIVFCAKDLEAHQIIRNMLQLTSEKVNFKIAPPESLSIIGSNSINTAGDLYVVSFDSLAKEKNRRKKRLFDIWSSVILLLGAPFLVFYFNKPGTYLKNCFRVFWGRFTWVGYCLAENINTNQLPSIRKGVLSPADNMLKNKLTASSIERLNLLYAKEYRVYNDFVILFKSFKKIGS